MPAATQSLRIERADEVAATTPTLQLALAVQLGERATAALDAGLMLAFEVEWRLADGRRLRQHLVLRYSPLLRSYELAIGDAQPQPHALRNHLLAAMENARLRWPQARGCVNASGGEVRVRLDPAALPAPLRLPALVDGDWRFDSGWVVVGHEGTQAGVPPGSESPVRLLAPAPGSCTPASRALVPSCSHALRAVAHVAARRGAP